MAEVITSRGNPRVKWARSVRDGRVAGMLWVEGGKLLEEALLSGWQPEIVFWVDGAPDPRESSLLARHVGGAGLVLRITEQVMQGMADSVAAQPWAAVLRRPQAQPLPFSAERLLILDRIQDPGNLGSLLRSAQAAGVQGALLLKGCADPYSPKALRGSMGAAFRLPMRLDLQWSQALSCLPEGMRTLVACADGACFHDQLDWPQRWALVLGNEGRGVDPAIASQCDRRVAVAMQGGVESLNVAAAGAVLMFEAARRRRV